MKTMRKLFTVLLALAMTLALAVSAFAADTGSITITNPQGDHTYTAYKIFDVTYTADGVNYSYTISETDAAFSTVKAYADVAANGLTLTPVANTNKYNVSIGAGFSAASFAQYLKTNVGSLGTGIDFTKAGDTMKASGLALGYYFVSGTSGTVCELATAKDIQIRDKNEVPQIEKSVDDNDGTVEIGQVLTYHITGKVPSTTGYTEFTYQVTDTMTEGLTFSKDVKVTIGGTDVTAAATITNNEDGFVASVNMMKYQDQIDKPVVITYTATVNEKAIQREKETNTATLKYSNNPADKDSYDESTVTVDVFSFNIVINKYAANNAETKLEGAKFVLKKGANGPYYKYDAATKVVSWVDAKADATEVSTDANGAAHFDGLQAGTYSLEETVAPAGYNQLTKDIIIVLDKTGSATINGAASTLGDARSLTAGVANSTGTVLPETGGTGTVIFVALGALAVICAGVFLVTNKRMSKESF
jgi:fimbrial isopeptide formation D2 family protein/LPXTG-motif cell wall-anchored protein